MSTNRSGGADSSASSTGDVAPSVGSVSSGSSSLVASFWRRFASRAVRRASFSFNRRSFKQIDMHASMASVHLVISNLMLLFHQRSIGYFIVFIHLLQTSLGFFDVVRCWFIFRIRVDNRLCADKAFRCVWSSLIDLRCRRHRIWLVCWSEGSSCVTSWPTSFCSLPSSFREWVGHPHWVLQVHLASSSPWTSRHRFHLRPRPW